MKFSRSLMKWRQENLIWKRNKETPGQKTWGFVRYSSGETISAKSSHSATIWYRESSSCKASSVSSSLSNVSMCLPYSS